MLQVVEYEGVEANGKRNSTLLLDLTLRLLNTFNFYNTVV
jgi:hypothetical protein